MNRVQIRCMQLREETLDDRNNFHVYNLKNNVDHVRIFCHQI